MATVEEVEEEEEEEEEDQVMTKGGGGGGGEGKERLLGFDMSELAESKCVQVDQEQSADKELPELEALVKKHETKLEPIDQQLLELGPFAKERHDSLHHDWPLPPDMMLKKRKPYSPTSRGPRRTRSTDEPSPLAAIPPEQRREPVKRTRRKRGQKDAPVWSPDMVSLTSADVPSPSHPVIFSPMSVGEVTSSKGLVSHRETQHTPVSTSSSSSQESTAAEAMLALSASHPPLPPGDPSAHHQVSSPGSSIKPPLKSDQVVGMVTTSAPSDSVTAGPIQQLVMVAESLQGEGKHTRHQSFPELYPPTATSPLVSECHRALPTSTHPSIGSHTKQEPSLSSSPMLRAQVAATALDFSKPPLPATKELALGYVSPQVIFPGVVPGLQAKNKPFPNLPQLSKLPDNNQLEESRRRRRSISGSHFTGMSQVMDESRTQGYSIGPPQPISSMLPASATPPPPLPPSEKSTATLDAKFGPANPFWPVPPSQQPLQQQQQQQQQPSESSQTSATSGFALPFVAGWPGGAATAFRPPFLPGLSSFPPTISALDLSSSTTSSSSSPGPYRQVLPPYYFITPAQQYQLAAAAAAAVGMKTPFVNSPLPSSSPSSSLAGGTLAFPAGATSPNPTSTHLSAFKTLHNVRSFTPPALHPLSSTAREDKPVTESPVAASSWIPAGPIIGPQFAPGPTLFNPSTFALGPQGALVPQLLGGSASPLPQAHLPQAPSDQVHSPPFSSSSARRPVRTTRRGNTAPEATPSPQPEHLIQRNAEQSHQLHESLEAEYTRWKTSLQNLATEQGDKGNSRKRTATSATPEVAGSPFLPVASMEGGHIGRTAVQFPRGQVLPLNYGVPGLAASMGDGESVPQRTGKEGTMATRGSKGDVRTSPEKMKLKIHQMNDEDFRAQEKGIDRRRKRRGWKKKEKEMEDTPVPPTIIRPLQTDSGVSEGSREARSSVASQGDQELIIDITTVEEGASQPTPLQELRATPPAPPPPPPHPSSLRSVEPSSSSSILLPLRPPNSTSLLVREPSPVSLASANTLLLLSQGQSAVSQPPTAVVTHFDPSFLPPHRTCSRDDISSEGTVSVSPSPPLSPSTSTTHLRADGETRKEFDTDAVASSLLELSAAAAVVNSGQQEHSFSTEPKEEERTSEANPPAASQQRSLAVQGRSTRSDSFSAAETMLLIAQGEDSSDEVMTTSSDPPANPPAVVGGEAGERVEERKMEEEEEEEEVFVALANNPEAGFSASAVPQSTPPSQHSSPPTLQSPPPPPLESQPPLPIPHSESPPPPPSPQPTASSNLDSPGTSTHSQLPGMDEPEGEQELKENVSKAAMTTSMSDLPAVGYQLAETTEEEEEEEDEDTLSLHADSEGGFMDQPLTSASVLPPSNTTTTSSALSTIPSLPLVDSSHPLSSETSTSSLVIDESAVSDTSPPSRKRQKLEGEVEVDRFQSKSEEEAEIEQDSISIGLKGDEGEEKDSFKSVGHKLTSYLPTWSEIASKSSEDECTIQPTSSITTTTTVSSQKAPELYPVVTTTVSDTLLTTSRTEKRKSAASTEREVIVTDSVSTSTAGVSFTSAHKNTPEKLSQLKKVSLDTTEKHKVSRATNHGGRVSKHAHGSSLKISSKLERRLGAMVSKQVGSSSRLGKSLQQLSSTSEGKREQCTSEHETVSSSHSSSSSSSSLKPLPTKQQHLRPLAGSDHPLTKPVAEQQRGHGNWKREGKEPRSRDGSSSRGHTPAHHSGDESPSPLPPSSSSSHHKGAGGNKPGQNRDWTSKKAHSFYASTPETHLYSSSGHRHHHSSKPRTTRGVSSPHDGPAFSSDLPYKPRSQLHHHQPGREDHSGWARSNHHHHHQKHRYHENTLDDDTHLDSIQAARSGSSSRESEGMFDDHSESSKRGRRFEDELEEEEVKEKRLLAKRMKHKHRHQPKHYWREGETRGEHGHHESSREDKHRHRHKHSKASL